MTPLSFNELQKYLSEILACNAFELHEDAENIYIPYMMNDALECYMCFPGAQLTGKYLPDFTGETTFEIIDGSSADVLRHGIIFRQGNENVFTLWFFSCHQALCCYRYDQIGHFWVKGEEHWRRLVYIIGTLCDKYEYFGDQLCTEKEKALLALMEFAPFRMYSPIHESLDSLYPDSIRGTDAMEALAKEAQDYVCLILLSFYRRFPYFWMKKIFCRALNRPGRIALYELLFQKVKEASHDYPERDYGDKRNEQIRQARRQITSHLHQQGFWGQYPLFQNGTKQILAMEEHPFTILEASDFCFRIQLMESETPSADARINAGFFKKKGNRSRILSV